MLCKAFIQDTVYRSIYTLYWDFKTDMFSARFMFDTTKI